jgi:hypothetical protein
MGTTTGRKPAATALALALALLALATLAATARAAGETVDPTSPVYTPAPRKKGDWHFVTGPKLVTPDSWSATREGAAWATDRHLTLTAPSGMCVGEERPSIQAQVQEAPPSASFPFYLAVITTNVLFPAYQEVVGTVEPWEPQPVCADIGLTLTSQIELGRPAAQVFVYDGNVSPPGLLLPGVAALHWRLVRAVGPRSIEIAVPHTGCAHLAIHAHATERRGGAVITAYAQPIGDEVPLGSAAPGTCLEIGGVQHLTVKLAQRVDRVRLLDGAFEPARPARGTRAGRLKIGS